MASNNQRLLEGEVLDVDDSASEAARLRDELRRVSGERDTLRAENIRLRQRVSQIDGPAAQLRRTLDPLYNALRAIMGEIEVIDPQANVHSQAEPVGGIQDGRTSPVWESWKARLSGAPAKIIEALQTHNEATVEQLVVLTQITRKQTIYDAIHRMNKAGLINKNGGRFSLKEL